MVLQPGAQAPDVSLTMGDARTAVLLSRYMGERPLVLLFFPMAFSSTCTEEVCEVAEDFAAYQELGAAVVAVSVDSPYVNVRFARETGAPFPILSDFNRAASRAYGVLRERLGHLEGVSERAAFVVDAAGTIAYTWVGENPGVYPPLDEIKAAVARLTSP
jgi:glutaredoxin-dependent peroxiredoxin